MKTNTYYLGEEGNIIDSRDVITFVVGIKLRKSRSHLYVSYFTPFFGYDDKITPDDLAYGKVTSASPLNMDSLLRDFSSIIQIEELGITDSIDEDSETFSLSIEDAWTLRVTEDDEALSQYIDNVLKKTLKKIL